MIWLLAAIALVATLAGLVALRRRGMTTGVPPFRARGSVLDGAECHWLGVLEEAAGEQRRVLPLVPAARVASPAPAASPPTRRLARRRLARTHLSFVVCERDSFAVCCVVEPWRPRWSRRRHVVETICRAAGIALVELPQTQDSPELVRERLAAAFATADGPACPRCRAPMRLHRGHRGALAGHTYWMCSDYPRCRAVAPAASLGEGSPLPQSLPQAGPEAP